MGPEGTSTAEEINHDTTRERYIKPAVTLVSLVSAMGISLLPYCIYRAATTITGSLNVNIAYATYLILQLNPLLDSFFFAATQRGVQRSGQCAVHCVIRT